MIARHMLVQLSVLPSHVPFVVVIRGGGCGVDTCGCGCTCGCRSAPDWISSSAARCRAASSAALWPRP
jgi:hypothetical protein